MLRDKIYRLNQDRIRVGVSGFLEGPAASAVLQECRYFILPNSQPLSAKSGTAIAAVQNGLVLVSRGADHPEDTKPFVHLKNCYLLSEVTPSSIAGAISRLDASPRTVKTIQEGAQQLRDYFSWPHIAKEHLKIYSEL
jgi:glycosyltransferase involved in cell wall biosynthesis